MFGFLLGLASLAVGAIGSIVTTIGTAVATAAKTFIALAPKLESLVAVANVITGIAQIVGTLSMDESAEDIGAKAMQEGVRHREPEESAEDYLNYIRNDVELDKERQAAMDQKDRMAAAAIGSALVLEATVEKSNVNLTPEYIVDASKAGLSPRDTLSIGRNLEKSSANGVDSFGPFLRQELDAADYLAASAAITEALRADYPDLSEREIKNEVIQMERALCADET